MNQLNKLGKNLRKKTIPVLTSAAMIISTFGNMGLAASATSGYTASKTYAEGDVVTFYLNGGSLDSGSTTPTSVTATANSNKEVSLVDSSSQKTGFHLVGWSVDNDGDVDADEGDIAAGAFTSKTSGESAYYAVWGYNQFTVKYDANGGTGSVPANQSVTYGITATVSNSDLSKTGYTRSTNIWNTQADGNGDGFSSSADLKDIETSTSTVTLYAGWTENKYSITLNANGGTVTSATTYTANTSSNTATLSSVGYDDEVKLPKVKSTTAIATNQLQMTKTGYTFAGWATSASGDVVYSDSATVSKLASTSGAEVTLYAVWTAGDITLTYADNLDGEYDVADDSTTTVTVTAGKTVTHTNPFTQTGYTGTVVANGGSTAPASFTEDTTLFIKWEANTYTVAYDLNGGSGSVGSTSATYNDTTATFAANSGTKSGYTFVGWANSASATTPDYYAGDTIYNLTSTNNATVTVYAVWVATDSAITVTFDSNKPSTATGAISETMNNQVVTSGTATKLHSNVYTLPEYTFQGWATESAGAVKYADGDSIKITAATTLYAVWKLSTYTVSFDANGGSGTTAAVTLTDGDDGSAGVVIGTVPTNKFTRKGYEWSSWNTMADGTGDTLATSTSITKDVTYYAIWTPGAYVIKFNANGGKGSNGTIADTSSVLTSTLGAGTFASSDDTKVFAGYSLDKSASSPEFTIANTVGDVVNAVASTLDAGEDITLYAIYIDTAEAANEKATAAAAEAASAKEEAANAKSAQTAAEAAQAAAEGKLSAYLSDGSSAGIPAAVGSELKNDGQKTGFVVTNATAGSATVEYKGTSDDKLSTSITIPSTVKDASGNEYKVTSIAKNAFAKDTRLKTVVIPSTVTSIGKNAFKSAKNVKKITINANANLKVGKNAFKNLKKGSKIVVKGISGSAKKKLVKKIKKQVTASKTTVK